MNVIRIIVALVIGALVGGVVNMGLVLLGAAIIPAPDGVDVNDPDSIAAAMHLFEPKHFVFPLLAHAGGTLAGAVAGHIIAGRYRNQIAFTVGALFFVGGIAAAAMIPAPVWFVAADLVFSYFPMAFVATKIGFRLRSV